MPRKKAPKRSACGRYWYDEATADKAVAFFPNHLRLTTAEWAGRPFTLSGWQEHDIIRPLFGWKRADGTRRYRRCVVWVPRKNGKTELAAGIALLMLIGDGEFAGEVYAMASKEDQAKIVFAKASAMVQMSEALSGGMEALKTSIWFPELMASFKPLAGLPKGSHGMNMSGLIGDEVHEWTDDRLYTYVHQSSGARRQPLEFLISTFGQKQGYGWELWQHCEKVLDGTIEDPETLIVVYAADPDDDWTDPATWAKANPNFPISPKREYLEAECRAAQELPRKENDFKRYHLNIWTEQDVRWLPMDKWDACGLAASGQASGSGGLALPEGGAPDYAKASPGKAVGVATMAARNERWRTLDKGMDGRFATAGLDLSTTTDLTALLWTFPPEIEGGRWTVISRFFVPEERILERARRDRVPYDTWRDMGALIATPGNVVDYSYVKKQLYADAERFKAGKVAIDRWNATQIAIEIAAEGLEAELFGQGYASMSAPAKELERLVLDGRLDHGGHPVLRWCAQNVAVETDAAGNIKPSKAKSTERIDGIVALVEALGVAMAQEIEAPSVYEQRGLRRL
jgi:phage terminase large subunit-like protein